MARTDWRSASDRKSPTRCLFLLVRTPAEGATRAVAGRFLR